MTGCSVGIFVGCRVLGLGVGKFVVGGGMILLLTTTFAGIQFSPSLFTVVATDESPCAAVVVDDVEGFGTDDNDDGGGLLLFTVATDGLGLELMGHPVIPAKQLCVGSEHSRRDPPGHASHTRLALDADTPHYTFTRQ